MTFPRSLLDDENCVLENGGSLIVERGLEQIESYALLQVWVAAARNLEWTEVDTGLLLRKDRLGIEC